MTDTDVSALRAYVEQFDELPPELVLGRLVLNTISEEKVRRDDLVRWFDELDLDESFLPMENKAVDAFKKAVSDTKDSYPLSRGREAHLIPRDVASNTDYIQRQITREIQDGGVKKLTYDEGITVTFYRALRGADQSSARLEVTPNLTRLPTSEHPYIQQAAKDVYTRYDSYLNYCDSQKVRAMVRGYLRRKLNAIEVKGGVYFVHCSRDDELGRLAELVNRLGGRCEMILIPIPDSQRQRAFVVRTYEREAAQSLNDLTRDIAEAASGNVTPAAYARLKARFDEVITGAEEHTLTLQISQDSTTASAEVAQKALADLAEKMVSDD